MFGYNRTEFLTKTAIGANGAELKEIVYNEKTENFETKNVYYYKHKQTACYYCIVNASDASKNALDELYRNNKSSPQYKARLQAYYNAIAREKNNLVKLSDYINGSRKQNLN